MTERDMDAVYIPEEGEEKTCRQIGYSVRYEGTEVEKTENGYIVAETEYKRESGR